MIRCGFVGCTNKLVTASCRSKVTTNPRITEATTQRTLCSSVVRSRFVLRSHMHTLPSVAPVTTVPAPADPAGALEPSTAPTILTKTIASTLCSSVWPPRAEMTSPLLRLTTRTPPFAPPTTTTVEAGLTESEVMPPKSNRASCPVSLKSGVGDLGSQ